MNATRAPSQTNPYIGRTYRMLIGVPTSVRQANTYATVAIAHGYGSSESGCDFTLRMIIVVAATSMSMVNQIAAELLLVKIHTTIVSKENINSDLSHFELSRTPYFSDRRKLRSAAPKKTSETKTEARPPSKYWENNTMPFMMTKTNQLSW